MIDDGGIVTLLRREFPDIAAAYRFGSTINGIEQPGSDIDLAILLELPIDPVRRFAVQERLAGELRRDVDLVDLAAASTVMRMQIVSGGRVLATFDQRKRDVFENYVFSSYARLNEERRDILERVAREGRVYGG
jgi:predicted nucleotidyltransferase